MSRRGKERTSKLSFLDFCQDIFLDIVATYLLAHTAWEKYIKWTQSNDTNTLFRFYLYTPAWCILPFLQELPMIVHTGEKPCKCPRCDETFSLSGILNTHQMTLTWERSFAFFSSDMFFLHYGSLNIHRKAHSGEKPYSCPQCPKAFFQMEEIWGATSKLTGCKKYKCTEWEKPFFITMGG